MLSYKRIHTEFGNVNNEIFKEKWLKIWIMEKIGKYFMEFLAVKTTKHHRVIILAVLAMIHNDAKRCQQKAVYDLS